MYKRALCSVEIFARFAFVSSQSSREPGSDKTFVCFAFMSSQTYDGFFLTVCMFHWHLCCHKRLVCSV